jgi:hypothetical protein
MTNKQLYNLVLENYIQAKKELIREGYLKREESNKIDFNEIFDRKSTNKQPSISLKSDRNFYDFTIDDFEIHDVTGIKKLSFDLEIAV